MHFKRLNVWNPTKVGRRVISIISAVTVQQHTTALQSIRLTLPNTHPLLICDNVVAAVLFGQMRCQDIKAPAELRKHHVVWVS